MLQQLPDDFVDRTIISMISGPTSYVVNKKSTGWQRLLFISFGCLQNLIHRLQVPTCTFLHVRRDTYKILFRRIMRILYPQGLRIMINFKDDNHNRFIMTLERKILTKIHEDECIYLCMMAAERMLLLLFIAGLRSPLFI